MITHSEKETFDIGKKIALNLQKGDIVCLIGNLGSGKTVLTKGIAAGLGINKDRVISPTFVLIRQHRGKNKLGLYHLDLYRLNNINDILELGYEEYFYGDGIAVIEWADKLKCLMPKQCLKIRLSVKGKEKRIIDFTAMGSHYEKLLERLNEDIRH
ncbi:MAG: tRNA (adenosine(37)-N6)-threonylcarbamoyltransferase complex ATPase subunit type 1 TsaE [Candidatus Omnitrophota bacterium]